MVFAFHNYFLQTPWRVPFNRWENWGQEKPSVAKSDSSPWVLRLEFCNIPPKRAGHGVPEANDGSVLVLTSNNQERKSQSLQTVGIS